ncbi:MAG: energy transducer TonB, partial [Bacteriovoracaceae bacterium]|nr:energy transducer TonB [Bacteriovoracaceae bacterium]
SESEGGDVKRASSNNDYIKNAQLGDITNLNTAEYKFYGFYARIRGQLEQYWGSELKSKSSSLFKKGRSIASGQELITNLEITIDKEGKIIKVAIVTTSGVQEIDEAAIDAFEKAGPFPNPPKELVLSGEAILRWGFVVRS